MKIGVFSIVGVAILSGTMPTGAAAQESGAPPFSPPKTAVTERLDWFGDPGAPNLSGVWMLAEDRSKTVVGDPKGWRPWPPPLKGKFLTLWRQRVAQAKAGTRVDDPVIGCQPPGMPRFVTGDRSSLLIIQSHQRVTLMRSGEGARRIWLDGRVLPPAKDLEPFYKGISVGRYDGQELVVDSGGFKDWPIDSTGVPHSDKLHISEHYRRLDAQTMKVDVTLTDPDAYSRPIVSTVFYHAVTDPNWEPKEFICTPKTDYHPDRYAH